MALHAQGAGPWAAPLSLGAGFVLFFLASDWMSGLASRVFKGHEAGHGSWTAWQGWSLLLGGASALSLGLKLAQESPGLRPDFWAAFAALGLLVMIQRIWLPPRHLLLLTLSSLLLSAPATLIGTLNLDLHQGAFLTLVIGAYFASTPLFVQTWLRGKAWPKARKALALLPFMALSVLLARHAWTWPAILLAAFAGRAWDRLLGSSAPKAGPPDPAAIRALGKEQAAWSILYCLALTLSAT